MEDLFNNGFSSTGSEDVRESGLDIKSCTTVWDRGKAIMSLD